MKKKNLKAQVWIETMLYTLIAFAMMAAVLAVAKPKIEQMQDKILIDRSLEMINEIDKILSSVSQSQGNIRTIQLGIKAGTLILDNANEKIIFEIESKSKYSESGQIVVKDGVDVLTEEKGSSNKVTLSRAYSNYDFKFELSDNAKSLTKSSTNYKLIISNNGLSTAGKTIINFDLG